MADKRLIDANALKAYINREHPYSGLPMAAFICTMELLEYAPTVDAVEVVRCKDCKSWEQYNACNGTKPHRCMNYDAIFYKRTKPDDFCSYGERKDNDDK